MTCEELLKALNEYVDGAELSEICEEFAQHLAGCNPCQVVVDNIRQTITLYHEGKPFQMPKAFEQRMQQSLKARWEEKFGKSGHTA
jgi:F420-dependent methylenetetrahydromethanopterin dehydrogenase